MSTSPAHRSVKVPLHYNEGDITLTVTYDPAAAIATYVGLEPKEEQASDEQVAYLAASLVGWDLLDDDGQPIPISIETLNKTSSYILHAIDGAMAKDWKQLATASPVIARVKAQAAERSKRATKRRKK